MGALLSGCQDRSVEIGLFGSAKDRFSLPLGSAGWEKRRGY